MIAFQVMFPLLLLWVLSHVNAEPPLDVDDTNGDDNLKSLLESDLKTCETQLGKYRRFLMQAIVSFEDVCDAYTTTPPPTLAESDSAYHGTAAAAVIFPNYQTPARRSDIWAFFKMLMAQFNDVEFAGVIRDAIIKRCRIKAMQRDSKRNTKVLGKKQRFHSWGGKRAFGADYNKNDRVDGYDRVNVLQGSYLHN